MTAHRKPLQLPIPALLALTACVSPGAALRKEAEIPELTPFVERYRALEVRTRLVSSDATGDAPVRIAVHETGAESDRVVVLIHGVLSDSATWRHVVAGLADDARVWAIDLPGCGDSDRPDAASLGPSGYTPDWSATHVLQVLRTQLADRPAPTRMTLVGHSLGGGIVLRMLGNPDLEERFADVIERVDGAVLMAPLEFGHCKADPELAAVATATDVEIALGRAFGIVERAVCDSVRHGAFDPDWVCYEDYRRLYDIVADPARLHAAQWYLLRAAPFRSETDFDFERANELVADYANVDVPCLVVWGRCDQTLTVASGYKLVHELPDARLCVLRRSKHGLPTERPAACVDLIRGFAERGLRDLPLVSDLPPGGPRALDAVAIAPPSSR